MPLTHIQGPTQYGRRYNIAYDLWTDSWSYYATPYYLHWTPDREQRPKPLETGRFALDNTPRTYYHFESFEFGISVFRPPPPYGWWSNVEYVPCGYGHGDGGDAWYSVPDLNTRLLLAIKDQKLSLGMLALEYRQTASMFHKACSLLYHGYTQRKRISARALKTLLRTTASRRAALFRQKPLSVQQRQALDMKKIEELINFSTSSYLAYIFGWEQVAKDLYGAAVILSDRTKQPFRRTISVRAMERTQRETSGLYGGAWPYQDIDQAIVTSSLSAQFHVNPGYQDLARSGISNPLHALFDGIPFSFVLNWLWPIGTYLQTLDALIGIEDLRVYGTKKVKVSFERTMGGARSVFLREKLTRTGISQHLSAPIPGYKPSKALELVETGMVMLAMLKTSRDLGSTNVSFRNRRV